MKYTRLISKLFTDKRSSLGMCVMLLDKIYYDPKHTARFSSAAKLVNAAKINKRNV